MEKLLDPNLKSYNSFWMRTPMNPDHPLTRLRVILSTDSQAMTRELFGKRVGIPAASIKAIETGVYSLTPEVATKISYATGVHPRSLLAGDDPLFDLQGQPFSKDSPALFEPLAWAPEYREAIEQLFLAALDMAREKKVSLLFCFLFEVWLSTAIEAFDLETLFTEKLTDRLSLFDPLHIPPRFYPRTEPFLKQWKAAEEQIQKEQLRMAPPIAGGRYDFQEYVSNLNKVRTEARKRLRRDEPA